MDVAALYRAYFPIVLRKCRRMLGDGDDAQDVAQETFVRLWRAQEGLDDPRLVVGWIYTTSTRLAVDRIRARRPAGEDPDGIAASAGDLPERLVAARRLLARVAGALDAPSLELLVLSRLDGMTHLEIGALLRTSERTVRRRLAELDVALARLGGDDD